MEQQTQETQETITSESKAFDFAEYKQEFLGKLPEEERVSYSKTLEQTKDLDSVLKGYLHAQKQMGKAIFLPEGEEGWDKIYSKLGRPENPEGYDFKFEDFTLKEEIVKQAQKTAFEAGLTPKQAQAMTETFVNATKAELEAIEAATNTAQEEFQQYKNETYGDKLSETENVLASFLEENAGDKIEEIKTLINGNAPLFDLLVKAAEGTTPKDGANLGGGSTGPKSAEDRLEELRNNKEWVQKFQQNDPKVLAQFRELVNLKAQGK